MKENKKKLSFSQFILENAEMNDLLHNMEIISEKQSLKYLEVIQKTTLNIVGELSLEILDVSQNVRILEKTIKALKGAKFTV